MSGMPKLRVGYVPEHFSSPLLQLAASGDNTIELVSCPSGTGQMITALKERDIDVAVALTESLIAGIALGKGDYKLIGTYVTTPLSWAVISGKDAKYSSIKDLRGEKIGISRPGSGSQVMASVMALNEGWISETKEVDPIEFVVNDSFQRLRDSVNDGSTAAFMWEWFTTKPFSDSGEVKFIGNVLTPWSSWMIAASPSSTSPALSAENLQTFISKLSASVQNFGIEKGVRSEQSVEFVKHHFGYEENDVKDWMEGVAYPSDVKEVSEATWKETLKVLGLAGVVKEPAEGFKIENFVDTKVAKLVQI